MGILTDVDEIISNRNPSPEDLEFGTSQSENFCNDDKESGEQA